MAMNESNFNKKIKFGRPTPKFIISLDYALV